MSKRHFKQIKKHRAAILSSLLCAGKVLQKSVERYLSRCTACNAAPDACIHSGHCEIPEVTQALSTVPVPDALQTAASSIASKFGVAQAKSVLVDDKKTCEFCRVRIIMKQSVLLCACGLWYSKVGYFMCNLRSTRFHVLEHFAVPFKPLQHRCKIPCR